MREFISCKSTQHSTFVKVESQELDDSEKEIKHHEIDIGPVFDNEGKIYEA
jgi:hypothetical protein